MSHCTRLKTFLSLGVGGILVACSLGSIPKTVLSQGTVAQTSDGLIQTAPESDQESANVISKPSPLAAPKTSGPESSSPESSGPAATEAERQKNLAEMVKLGDQHYVDGDYKAAIVSYTEALASYNQNAYVYYNRANAYRKLGKNVEAIQDYSRSIQLNSSYMFAYLYRGTLLNEVGEYQKAVEDFSAGLKLVAQEPRLHLGRADAYRGLKDKAAAIADYESAIELSKKQDKNRLVTLIQKKLQDVKRQN